ncbi:hypothetical protein MPER_05996 [Moniliophthora perniciosa FA553]|nr:hypothetical protein MPER_05996 [Moniliophthora perniciosa FA553]
MSTEKRINSELAAEYESLKAERDALAVENASFKHALSVILEHVDVTDKGQAGVVAMIANDELFNSETPATDAALAAIQAQGVEKLADKLEAEIEQIMRGAFFYDEIPVVRLSQKWSAHSPPSCGRANEQRNRKLVRLSQMLCAQAIPIIR